MIVRILLFIPKGVSLWITHWFNPLHFMLILIVNPFLFFLSNYGSDEKQRSSWIGTPKHTTHRHCLPLKTCCPDAFARHGSARTPCFVLRLQQCINAFGTAFAGKIRLNGGVAQVLVRNVPATNGVLHGIDAPLVWGDGLSPGPRTEAKPPCFGRRGLRTKFTYKTPYKLAMKWEGGIHNVNGDTRIADTNSCIFSDKPND